MQITSSELKEIISRLSRIEVELNELKARMSEEEEQKKDHQQI